MTEQPDSAAMLSALRRHWGYQSFRPMQEAIVRSLLAGRDACVVMPTGGGKSLCYQLPAALEPGRTTVVVSPLIALMQDQVAGLGQMGIAAAGLHSGAGAGEQARTLRQLAAGGLRLLYLSPERLARADTLDDLGRAPLARIVIDEAHCISEWGHEFRPEYRQIGALRRRFPRLPIAAFTASATRRVRQDILAQLELREPEKFIASFHRPNLRYVVEASSGAAHTERVLARALRGFSAGAAAGNAIVYAPTIARVEQVAAWLCARGLGALPYHGKMETAARRQNQERWMNDEVRVLVGTLAFGLGIDKAAVRAVIHLALPKSVEQYYQEAGRAGRDGEPADCLLLWQKRDVGLLAHFIQEIEDPEERARAWQRYREVRNFAEAPVCRHRQICQHFGERARWESCGACDVCGYRPVWLGAEAGAAPARPAPAAKRPPRPVTAPFPGPAPAPDPSPAPEAADMPALRAYLRQWRLETARAARLPAYIVMHDRTLDELCRLRPRTMEELLEVPGFGERKVAAYGEQILAAVARFPAG